MVLFHFVLCYFVFLNPAFLSIELCEIHINVLSFNAWYCCTVVLHYTLLHCGALQYIAPYIDQSNLTYVLYLVHVSYLLSLGSVCCRTVRVPLRIIPRLQGRCGHNRTVQSAEKTHQNNVQGPVRAVHGWGRNLHNRRISGKRKGSRHLLVRTCTCLWEKWSLHRR